MKESERGIMCGGLKKKSLSEKRGLLNGVTSLDVAWLRRNVFGVELE